MVVWVTRHGPLFVTDGNDRMALRWVAAEPGMLQFPILDIDRAQNWEQFTAALARFPGPGSNFVYADVDGNIGYHAAGKLPNRRGYAATCRWMARRAISNGTASFRSTSFPRRSIRPAASSPPPIRIPFRPDYPYPVNGNFAPPDRVRADPRICFPRARDGAPRTCWRVQKDVYSALQQVPGRPDWWPPTTSATRAIRALDDAVALLRGWNGQMEKDLAAPFLITLAYQHVRTSMAEKRLARQGPGL